MPKQLPISYQEINEGLQDLGLKESSIKSYVSKMKKVLNGVFGDKSVTKQDLKAAKKKIVDYISGDDFKNANVRKVTLMAITHLFTLYDLDIDYFEKFVVDWSRLADAESVSNTSPKTIEDIKNIDFDEIKASIPKTKNPTDRLIKAFYAGYIPPLRQQDLIGLKIVENMGLTKDKSENVIVMRGNRMIIKDHKTSKHHGAKSIILPSPLMKEVKRYLKALDTDVLFEMSTSAFTRRMIKLFGCSTSTFRKAYVSKMTPSMTAEQRAKTAEIMGHRISTSLVSYTKDLKKDEDENDLKKNESESDEE